MTTAAKVKTWLGAAALVAGSLWGFHQWLGKVHLPVHLMTRAEAQTLGEQVKQASDAATRAAESAERVSQRLFDYIADQELKEERAKHERLEGELQDTLLWESQNGENQISRARKADLEARIIESTRRIRCLENPDRGGC